MTSREALEKIKKIEIVNAIDKWGCLETIHFEETFDFESEKGVNELLEIIEKDLDVLDVLKKYLVIATNSNDESQCLLFDRYIYNDDIDTEADFYLIKEWLENEEIN